VGNGIVGAGGTLSSGTGVFTGGANPPSVGGFTSQGGFIGGLIGGTSYPGGTTSGGGNFVYGMTGNVGSGIFFTNAPDAHALSGKFDTWTYNAAEFSIQFGWSDGIGILSITAGGGSGSSISRYPTDTVWTADWYW
jgi:hypothetical protein